MAQAEYTPANTGSYEINYDESTKDAIVAYLQDQNSSGNQIDFEIGTEITRDVEAVAFTNEKMYRAEVDVNATTCLRSVRTPYIWLDGDSASGDFVISDDVESYTYVSSDGKIGTVTQTSSGDEVKMVKVNEELNATQLMSATSLFLPATAHGYRVSYMNIATGLGGSAIRLDEATIRFMESYFRNNPLAVSCQPLPE